MKKLNKYFNNDELAANVWLSKYALEGEETPDDMHRRMAKEFARIENKYEFQKEYSIEQVNALSEYGKNRNELLEEDIYNFFKDFKYIVPQGSIMSQLGAESIGSLSNCFVIGQPEDSYGGIFQKDEEMAQLMKRRGGVGIDISTLRPQGTATSNAAKSSTGAISFMHRFSNTTREVAQNGRRGALMISIDINHPDVMEFIKIKRDLSQVTGANISVKLNDEFMKAVENDEDYWLRFPCDYTNFVPNEEVDYNILEPSINLSTGKTEAYVKRVKAKEYWDEIIKSAHNVAEPGLMFWDNMVNYSPDGIYPQFKQVTTNPCSEIGMQPYDACRLIAVNLFSFVDSPFTSKAKFNFKKFYEVNYEAMRLSDDLIDLEIEHIKRIVSKIENDPESSEVKLREATLWYKVLKTASESRRTGLGFTALGDTLAALNLKYDSKEGLEIIDSIMRSKLESELDCTIDLAILRGAFEGWNKNIEFDLIESNELVGNNSFYNFIAEEFPEKALRMFDFGRRNVSWSTVAPTGTVSLMCQTTSGIEPLFMGYYMRRKKVNPNDKDVRVDFTDQNGDTWQEFPILHEKFKDWINISHPHFVEGDIPEMSKEDLQQCFEESPWYKSTANGIDWIKRVEIQSTIQKYITHSISSTINLPEDVSEEEVSKIYLESWKKGLKGITVYRDGSRSGVLVTNTKKKETFEYKDAPKRPEELDAEVYHVTSKGERFTVVVGLYENKPYEVFCSGGEQFKHLELGKLIKKSRGVYEFNGVTIDQNISDEEIALTRMISTALRHGADIRFVVEQLNKSGGTIVSFSKAISRTIKKYIPDGAKATVKCKNPDCTGTRTNVVFEEGCHKCLDCGDSKCG